MKDGSMNKDKMDTCRRIINEEACSLFVRLISHQLSVLFSQNKPATSNQPAVLLLSEQISTSHQPPASWCFFERILYCVLKQKQMEPQKLIIPTHTPHLFIL
jgi:hypothetical protein